MIFRDGCVNMEDELNNTCNQTQEKEDEDFDLQASFIYICFGQSMMFFIVLLQTSIMFSKEIVYFRNEHQNGVCFIMSDSFNSFPFKIFFIL